MVVASSTDVLMLDLVWLSDIFEIFHSVLKD